MGKYTAEELENLKQSDPMRYFYYSHEDEYKEIGVDFDNERWETPFHHNAGKQNGRDSFTYFHDMVCSDGGATVIAPDGRLINISENKGITELSPKAGRVPVFKFKHPVEAPAPLGRWFRFLNRITGGLYGRSRLREYENRLNEHNIQERELEAAKARFETTELAEYRKRALKFEDHRMNLKHMGKDLKECTDVTDEIRKHLADEKERKILFDKQAFNVSDTLEQREHGRARLDYLAGPRRGDIKEEQAKRWIKEDGTFADSNGNKELEIMDIALPECKAFSDHQIALLGLGAMCDPDFAERLHRHPIPGGPENNEKLTETQKNEIRGIWYNNTESLFTRKRREICTAVPWVNNARAEVADALAKYNSGDKSAVAKMLKDGLHQCSRMLIKQESVTDSNTLADYSFYAGEMLDMLNSDKELLAEAEKIGFTERDYKDGIICANVGTAWDRGLEAQKKLINNPEMSAEEKQNAIVDVIGMRITQSLLHNQAMEVVKSEGYTSAFNGALETLGELQKSEGKLDKHDPDYRKQKERIMGSIDDCNNRLAQMQMGYMLDAYGIATSFTDTMNAIYAGKGKPDELRDTIRKKIDVEKLGERSCDKLLVDLLANKSQDYVRSFFKKENAPQNEKQNVKENVVRKQNNIPVK